MSGPASSTSVHPAGSRHHWVPNQSRVDPGGLLDDVAHEARRRVHRLVDVPHQRRVEVVLPVCGPARRVGVQPLLELTAHVEAEVAAGAEGEDRPVRDRLGRDEPSNGAGVLHASAGLGHLLGQLALGADGELLDLAQRIELAHRDHGHVATAQLPVDVGAEGTDLDEGDVEAHLAEPDDAGGDDGEKSRASRTMRGRRSDSCERSGACAWRSASASSGVTGIWRRAWKRA